MKPVRVFLGVLALAVYLFFAYTNRLPPFWGKPNTRATTVAEVSSHMIAVRLEGTAHFPLRISQPRGARFNQPAGTWWLFPLFPPGDTSGREIRVLVSSPYEPDTIVSFEDMTVEGWARSASELLNPDMRAAFEAEGYRFAPDVVLIDRFPD